LCNLHLLYFFYHTCIGPGGSSKRSNWERLTGAFTMLVLLGIPWMFSAFGSIDSKINPELEIVEQVFSVWELLTTIIDFNKHFGINRRERHASNELSTVWDKFCIRKIGQTHRFISSLWSLECGGDCLQYANLINYAENVINW